jgi:cytochrome d ubiquinol oxidase subunit I
MMAAVITGSFVVCAVGAYYLLSYRHIDTAKVFLKVGVITGLMSSILILYPTGDAHGKLVAKYQPAALAAMEGKFETGDHAELAIIGEPDIAHHKLINPVVVPYILSYLAYGSFGAEVKGMDAFPTSELPDNIDLVYFSYHIMAGLGTLQIALMMLAAFLLWKRKLYQNLPMLWILMLAVPFPYIATTMGWMTAELGRQPWIVHGIMRTIHGNSPTVSGGEVAFSALGFAGLYIVVGLLFLYLISKQLATGPKLPAGDAQIAATAGAPW